jgi:hypothetical protein
MDVDDDLLLRITPDMTLTEIIKRLLAQREAFRQWLAGKAKEGQIRQIH